MAERILIVGDPHVTPNSLDECEKLLELIQNTARNEKVDTVLFLGDLYHTHAVLHVEVLAFWTRWMACLGQFCKVVALVGNHDLPGNDGSSAHALIAQQAFAVVVDSARIGGDSQDFPSLGIGYLPYFSSPEKFKEEAKNLIAKGAKTIFCHQTFAGSRFEAGFYAPDGVDAHDLDCDFISGHIHTPQTIGRVWYPGAPRWRSLADANTDRHIWVLTFDDAGALVDKKQFSTSGACREIRHMELTEGREIPAGLNDPAVAWSFDVRGSERFVEEQKALLKDRARVRCFVDAPARSGQVTESAGIPAAIGAFLQSYVPPNGTSKDVLTEMLVRRGVLS